MLTLAIDTSTNILSVALVRGDEVLASINEQTKNNQSALLMSKIEKMMTDCHLKPSDLEKIAVAFGPGSYTGVRVGVAVAKSLAYALAIPVVGISSLEIMTRAAVLDELCVAMIDARRGTVFAGVYHGCSGSLIPDGHYTLDVLLSQLNLEEDEITFVGDGAVIHKVRLLAASEHAQVKDESEFEHSKAVMLAHLAKDRSPQENIHALKPSYLRQTEAEMNAGV